MRLTFLSIVLPLWAACGLWAQDGNEEKSESQTVSAQDVPQQENHLQQLLDDMVATQDDDFYAAAAYVLEETGDELAFHARMREMAEREHPAAMLWLALSLRSAESPYQDEKVSALFRKLVLSAADKGYLPAMVQAALALYYGAETEGDRAQGQELLMRACKRGSARARACHLVMSGMLTDKNSDLEAPEVAAELKRCNHYVEEIVAEAHWGDAEWLHTASEHGSARAAYELALRGNLREGGSLSFLRLAAERHMPEAMTTLGCFLCLGPLPAHTDDQSPHALPESALPPAPPKDEKDKKDEQAQGGESPEAEPMPSAASVTEGLMLLRRAVSMGDERAAAFVALAYAGGMGKDVSPERIAALFRYAHERELPYGTAGWGYCLVSGKGCEQNVQQGLELLRQTEEQGVSWVNLALFHLYKDGIGVDKNETKASEYRRKFENKRDFTPFLPSDAAAPFFPGLQ